MPGISGQILPRVRLAAFVDVTLFAPHLRVLRGVNVANKALRVLLAVFSHQK